METCAAETARPPGREPFRFHAEALDAWGATISEKLIALRPDARQPAAHFEGRMVIARFHDSVVAEVRTSAHRVMRDRQLVSHDAHRYCKIVWQLDGCTQLEQKRGCAEIGPGQWALYDTSLPYAFEVCHGAHFIVLLLPLDEFSDYSAGIDRTAGKTLDAHGNALVARAALTGVLAGGTMDEHEAQRVLQDSLLALMGNAIRMVDEPGKETARASQRKLRAAQAYIDKNFADPTLTPDKVAAACGMSRRSLYDAFNGLAQTPRTYIQRQRLARARVLLADPENRPTITQVAYELGFADAAHLSRLFTSRYGLSPSQWRNTRMTAD